MNFPTLLVSAENGAFFVLEDDFYVRTALTRTGGYSPSELHLFKSLVGQGDVVADVGAHIGTLSIPLARHVGPAGKVIAFEPQRELFQVLCANAVVNGVRNLDARWAGVGAAAGMLWLEPLDPETSNYGARRLGPGGGAQDPAGESCQVLPLDTLGLTACRLIKIDAEGMEEDVLRGASVLLGLKPFVYFENSFFSDSGARERSARLVEHFHRLDYVLYWHCPRIVEPKDLDMEVFEGGGSVNVLAVPAILATMIDDLSEIHDLIKIHTPRDVVYPAWLTTSSVTGSALDGLAWNNAVGELAPPASAEIIVRGLADAINSAARHAGLDDRIATPSAAAWTLAAVWFRHLERLEGTGHVMVGDGVPAAFAAFVRARFAKSNTNQGVRRTLQVVGAAGSPGGTVPTLRLEPAAADDHAPAGWRDGPAYFATLSGPVSTEGLTPARPV